MSKLWEWRSKLWFFQKSCMDWKLDHKAGWVPKNWYFWTVVLEKTPESPLECKEIQPVHPKGNQSLIFIGRPDAEAEAPIPLPPGMRRTDWFEKTLIWKDPDAGKDWRWEEKEMTEDEMVGWHHWLDGYEFEQAPGVGDGQGSLVCCTPWGSKVLDTTEWLNWTEGKGGNAETKEEQGRNNRAVIKQVLVSPQGIYIFLRSLSGTKVPTPTENGNFRLSTRFLGHHHAVASPPTNQKKVICPAAITPNFAFKNSYPRWLESLRFLSMSCLFSLLGPCSKPFSAPNSNVSICLASLCIEHKHLGTASFQKKGKEDLHQYNFWIWEEWEKE